jgi:RNA polymerase sigma factor (sigma-70 family)
MNSPAPGGDTPLRELILRLKNGEAAAREALVQYSCDRLLLLTRAMFLDFPKLKRWEETGDVFQLAMIRLNKALREVEIQTVEHFFNLAGLQIRRTLLDLAKHHFGPEGAAANHQTPIKDVDLLSEKVAEPSDIAKWVLFHSLVEFLPAEEQEIVHLLFYENLSQDEAAKVLGISVRTLKRRWQSAKLKLHQELSIERQG